MNISSIQGMNAYTANAQMAETAPVQNNTKEATAPAADNEKSTQTPQEAFQVEITPQALTLQTQKQQDSPQEELNQQPTLQNLKTQQMDQPQVQQGSQLDVFA